MERKVLQAAIPIALEFPDAMARAIAAVLEGEYEAGYHGEELSIVDIGANVGAFAIWASLRWPGSTIHAYEPHPGSFELLARNTGRWPGIVCHRGAVYPGDDAQQMFFARYVGDGEAGLVACMGVTFETLPPERTFPVPIIRPQDLPGCDVLKVDVEGAEAAILGGMRLDDVSLILLEYQNDDNRRAIERLLGARFSCAHEDRRPWAPLLSANPAYRRSLRGDHFGHLYFVNRRACKLRQIPSDPLSSPVAPSLRQVLALVPGAARAAVERRLRKLVGR